MFKQISWRVLLETTTASPPTPKKNTSMPSLSSAPHVRPTATRCLAPTASADFAPHHHQFPTPITAIGLSQKSPLTASHCHAFFFYSSPISPNWETALPLLFWRYPTPLVIGSRRPASLVHLPPSLPCTHSLIVATSTLISLKDIIFAPSNWIKIHSWLFQLDEALHWVVK